MRRLRLGDDQPPFQALLLMDSEPGCSFPDLSYLHPGGEADFAQKRSQGQASIQSTWVPLVTSPAIGSSILTSWLSHNDVKFSQHQERLNC